MESTPPGAPPHEVSPRPFAADARFARGVALFDRQRYFEAHEVWEELWLELSGDERRFVAALIQVAAGYLKRESGITRGARRLWTRALANLEPAPRSPGVDVPALRAHLRASIAALDGAAPPSGPPRLREIAR